MKKYIVLPRAKIFNDMTVADSVYHNRFSSFEEAEERAQKLSRQYDDPFMVLEIKACYTSTVEKVDL